MVKLLISDEEFKQSKGKALISFICSSCSKEHRRTKSEIKHSITKGAKNLFCSRICQDANSVAYKEYKCTTCNKLFMRSPLQTKKSKNLFCSQSCAATYNNKVYPKKERKQYYCKCCNIKTKYKRKFCNKCFKKLLRNDYSKITLEDYETSAGSRNSYDAAVRAHARKTASEYGMLSQCAICGYSKIVQACHIKPVTNFPKTATIEEVNSPNNLVGLCPNHHLELDNNLLDKKYL